MVVIITEKEKELFNSILIAYLNDSPDFANMVNSLSVNQYADAMSYFRMEHTNFIHALKPQN